jgi:hypothetical protein
MMNEETSKRMENGAPISESVCSVECELQTNLKFVAAEVTRLHYISSFGIRTLDLKSSTGLRPVSCLEFAGGTPALRSHPRFMTIL